MPHTALDILRTTVARISFCRSEGLKSFRKIHRRQGSARFVRQMIKAFCTQA